MNTLLLGIQVSIGVYTSQILRKICNVIQCENLHVVQNGFKFKTASQT